MFCFFFKLGFAFGFGQGLDHLWICESRRLSSGCFQSLRSWFSQPLKVKSAAAQQKIPAKICLKSLGFLQYYGFGQWRHRRFSAFHRSIQKESVVSDLDAYLNWVYSSRVQLVWAFKWIVKCLISGDETQKQQLWAANKKPQKDDGNSCRVSLKPKRLFRCIKLTEILSTAASGEGSVFLPFYSS